MKKRDKQFNLLPNRFKYIGLGLVVLTLMFLVAVKMSLIVIAPDLKEMVKTYGLNLFILGLLFIALAKDKIEDEMTLLLKTKAFAAGFVGAIIYVLIWPLVNLIFTAPLPDLTGQSLALFMLLVHLFTYYLQKLTGKE